IEPAQRRTICEHGIATPRLSSDTRTLSIPISGRKASCVATAGGCVPADWADNNHRLRHLPYLQVLTMKLVDQGRATAGPRSLAHLSVPSVTWPCVFKPVSALRKAEQQRAPRAMGESW